MSQSQSGFNVVTFYLYQQSEPQKLHARKCMVIEYNHLNQGYQTEIAP